ncbi:MAG: 50S ribosomal protein L10 [Mycoplasmoidaceae bacterium]
MKKIIQFKESEVNKISDLMKSSASFLIFEYQGIDAHDMTAVRKEMLKSDASLHVIKNNILNRSLKKAGFEGFGELVGPNAIAFGNSDEIAPLKIINNLSKTNDCIKFKGSVIENKFIDAEKSIAISKLPNREGLYSMLLSCLTAPIRGVLYALKAVEETK